MLYLNRTNIIYLYNIYINITYISNIYEKKNVHDFCGIIFAIDLYVMLSWIELKTPTNVGE